MHCNISNHVDKRLLYSVKIMSLFQYFKKTDDRFVLPDPRSSSRSLPSAAIASANMEVRRCVFGTTLCGRRRYNSYTPEEKVAIARYALENGVMVAKRKFATKLKLNINERTVRRFKNAYIDERRRKRELNDDDEIEKLPHKKR